MLALCLVFLANWLVCSFNAPINVFPYYPLRHIAMGLQWGFDMPCCWWHGAISFGKIPHYKALLGHRRFDIRHCFYS